MVSITQGPKTDIKLSIQDSAASTYILTNLEANIRLETSLQPTSVNDKQEPTSSTSNQMAPTKCIIIISNQQCKTIIKGKLMLCSISVSKAFVVRAISLYHSNHRVMSQWFPLSK